ncbi:unnamed protein product [Rhizoctonia solani]|nr:unnamed protein product [Rhizoctonia solani]
MIKTDQCAHPQLVHDECLIPTPSGLVQFAARVGLAKGIKTHVGDAVAKAYMFVSRKFTPGDHVILVVRLRSGMDTDPYFNAAEILARHLYDGTCPGGHSKIRFRDGSEDSARQIPINGVVVVTNDQVKSITGWSNELKSRFPLGVEHIICSGYLGGAYQSCSTVFDSDGAMISREINISQNVSILHLRKRIIQHIIYYDKNEPLIWDEHEPIWTQRFSSPFSEPQNMSPSESIKPQGMYHHELRKHQLVGSWDGGPILVWKSYRSKDSRFPSILSTPA